MRREGRQHGWAYAVNISLVDPEGKRRVVRPMEGAAVVNGGFMRASRKPTNHSKFTGGRAYRELSGKGAAATEASSKGRHKFKHGEVKMFYLAGADGAAVDVYDVDA